MQGCILGRVRTLRIASKCGVYDATNPSAAAAAAAPPCQSGTSSPARCTGRAGRHVLERGLRGRLTLCARVREILRAVGQEAAPAARAVRGVERGRGNERVAVQECDERELVHVVVPVAVDARIADKQALHLNVVVVVDKLLGKWARSGRRMIRP